MKKVRPILEIENDSNDIAFLQAAFPQRCYQLGANSFVIKPMSIPERARLAKAIKEFWLHFHQLPPEFAAA